MIFLGVDFGLKRIGLALSEGELVNPWLILENSSGVLSRIANLCDRKGVGKIIVGLPEGKIALQAKDFGHKLSRKTGLPVVYHDETLTTKEAIDKMVASGSSQKKRREKKDAVAAALILQNFLENNV